MKKINLLEVIAETLTMDLKSDRDKAMRIFRWIQDNFKYDNNYRGPPRNLQHIFQTKKGICSELALVYTGIAKKAGVEAQYVHVDIDCDGKKVNHACCEVTLYD